MGDMENITGVAGTSAILTKEAGFIPVGKYKPCGLDVVQSDAIYTVADVVECGYDFAYKVYLESGSSLVVSEGVRFPVLSANGEYEAPISLQEAKRIISEDGEIAAYRKIGSSLNKGIVIDKRWSKDFRRFATMLKNGEFTIDPTNSFYEVDLTKLFGFRFVEQAAEILGYLNYCGYDTAAFVKDSSVILHYFPVPESIVIDHVFTILPYGAPVHFYKLTTGLGTRVAYNGIIIESD